MRRRTPKPDARHEYGEYLTSLNGTLDRYIKAHCPITQVDGWPSRRHLSHNELVELHKEAGCQWTHYGENYCEHMT